ncbi:MAG: anthranilate phosphoribosyltransferase [Candidatus Omnitrophica bacterium]|nr:anthranilate phosphoribosyltransferase [Candidatus Omnitrophota bacterium]
MIEEATAILSSGGDLAPAQMSAAMEEVMAGQAATSQIISFLSSLSQKGETVDELTAAVKIMRLHAAKIHAAQGNLLDTCGTGGDAKGTFNISTAVAFVAAGCGIAVAKHGNRSVSSCCGSADILEFLGININLTPPQLEACLEKAGIVFLFAQNMHPAMKYAMEARRHIGKRTMFNILGPLTNPAGATHQLVGVYDLAWVERLGRVLQNLGAKHALVVYGNDGLDEITTTDATFITEVRPDKIRSYQVKPEDFGIARAEPGNLRGGKAADNAKILLDILSGKKGPQRDIVAFNAAAAIYAADKAGSIQEGLGLAREAIDSGRALQKFELLKTFSSKK